MYIGRTKSTTRCGWMHGNVKDNGRTDKVIRSETTIQMVRGEEMMVITEKGKITIISSLER